MKEWTVEFDSAPPSNNELIRMNCWVKKRMMLNYRDQIIIKAGGEGPWRKFYPDKKFTLLQRQKVTEELRKTWKPKIKVFAEIIVRRPRRFDFDNLVGGCKILWDGLQWAGWCVSDHVKWLGMNFKDQVIGDHKTILRLIVPDSEEEIQQLASRGVIKI